MAWDSGSRQKTEKNDPRSTSKPAPQHHIEGVAEGEPPPKTSSWHQGNALKVLGQAYRSGYRNMYRTWPQNTANKT